MSAIARGILVIGGSGAAAISHFASDDWLAPWHLVGIIGSVLAIAGAIFVLATEHDVASSLEKARKAVVRAQDEERRTFSLKDYIEKRERVSARAFSIVNANNLFRTALDVMLDPNSKLAPEDQLVAGAVELNSRDLSIAMGFRLEEHWTIAVYKTEANDAPKLSVLRCIAQFRTTKCDTAKARSWPAGKGAAGLALLTGDEYVVVDTLDNNNPASIRTLGSFSKSSDQFLYRSIAAIPVWAPGVGTPWGVVVATSDRPGHFSEDQRANVEVVRLLGKMVETILKVSLLHNTIASAKAPTTAISTDQSTPTNPC
jgi:hypothetical protein